MHRYGTQAVQCLVQAHSLEIAFIGGSNWQILLNLKADSPRKMTDNSCKCCDALLDFSTNVYQKVRDLEAKEKEEYDKLLGDIKKMEKWEDLEKETREKVNETEEFFEQFQNNEPDGSLLELIKESASKLNKAFSDLLERFVKNHSGLISHCSHAKMTFP